MNMHQLPSSERTHIGIFGKRNAGKSSIINAITGQSLAIVSDVKGTTTDPVLKSMELLPLGPVVIIDTPGLDDEGALGQLRIEKANQILNKTDIALLIVDSSMGMTREDYEILSKIKAKQIPYLIVFNKADELPELPLQQAANEVYVSALFNLHVEKLKDMLGTLLPTASDKTLLSGLIEPMDMIILVIPIDSSAPKGRLILPQQQMIRDILDYSACAIVVKDSELKDILSFLTFRPKLVITDSQVFAKVARIIPPSIPLTSFSILLARYKGYLDPAIIGAQRINTLKDNDIVLIAEGCTHHRQCEDIGTVKLPNLIRTFTGQNPTFTFTSGTEFPNDLHPYKLIIHCGGCMTSDREMKYRISCAEDAEVPITNYGIAMAYMNHLLERSIELF